MGRRFPEFCTLRAACRVSVRASPFATGDGRVASYQAAIDSVGARHYIHWPFMVEVLNKWLETNQDFVRDPLGYVASSSSPTAGKDRSFISTQDTASQTTVLTSDPQSSPTVAGSPTLSPPCHTEVSEHTVDSPSATGTEPDSWANPPPSCGPIPIRKIAPFSWIDAFRFPLSLGNLGTLTIKTSWFSLFFLSSSYERWWGTLRKYFAFRSG